MHTKSMRESHVEEKKKNLQSTVKKKLQNQKGVHNHP